MADDVASAIVRAKASGKVLAVHLIDPGTPIIWHNAEVAHFARRCLPGFELLTLQRGTETFTQFTQFHPVGVTPATALINAGTGQKLEMIEGAIAPADFTARLRAHCRAVSPAAAAVTPSPSAGASPTGSPPSSSPRTSRKSAEREKILALQRKMKARREARGHDAQQTGRAAEVTRREEGKAVQQAERDRQEAKRQREIQEMAKAAREAREARRLQHAAAAKSKQQQQPQPPPPLPPAAPAPAVVTQQPGPSATADPDAVAAAEPSLTRVRFRLPTRATLKHEFPATITVAEVRRFVVASDEFVALAPEGASFRLVDDNTRTEVGPAGATFAELGLAPRAALRIELDQPPSAAPPAAEGFCEWLMRTMRGLLMGGVGSPTPAADTMASITAANAAAEENRPVRPNVAQQSALRRRRPPGGSGVGGSGGGGGGGSNIRSFRNPNDDDDPEKRKKAYNGNSQETLQ
mmetsp:Transcript_23891/g.71291  ORF Transcript_23891/g.71291 Transcript_23891/m.71291 type:complete len:465 (+) Transcript_23891:37-1431(+)